MALKLQPMVRLWFLMGQIKSAGLIAMDQKTYLHRLLFTAPDWR
jgi:muconolactone delta-isomerase